MFLIWSLDGNRKRACFYTCLCVPFMSFPLSLSFWHFLVLFLISQRFHSTSFGKSTPSLSESSAVLSLSVGPLISLMLQGAFPVCSSVRVTFTPANKQVTTRSHQHLCSAYGMKAGLFSLTFKASTGSRQPIFGAFSHAAHSPAKQAFTQHYPGCWGSSLPLHPSQMPSWNVLLPVLVSMKPSGTPCGKVIFHASEPYFSLHFIMAPVIFYTVIICGHFLPFLRASWFFVVRSPVVLRPLTEVHDQLEEQFC